MSEHTNMFEYPQKRPLDKQTNATKKRKTTHSIAITHDSEIEALFPELEQPYQDILPSIPSAKEEVFAYPLYVNTKCVDIFIMILDVLSEQNSQYDENKKAYCLQIFDFIKAELGKRLLKNKDKLPIVLNKIALIPEDTEDTQQIKNYLISNIINSPSIDTELVNIFKNAFPEECHPSELENKIEFKRTSYQLLQNFINIYKGYGHLNYQEGLFVCAAKLHNKNHEHLIVLNGQLEYTNLLIELKKCPPPIRVRFIIASVHWCSGDISIDKNGKAQLFLCDSRGPTIRSEYIEKFVKYFSDSTISLSKEIRQYSSKGCSIFSLYDAIKLLSIEKHLDIKYYSTGLFGYTNDPQNSSLINLFDVKVPVYQTSLPILLLRPMQSQDLLTNFIPEKLAQEQRNAVNNCGDMGQSILQNKTGFFMTPKGVRNKYIKEKLHSIIKMCFFYLLNHDSDEILKQMHKYSLAGFIEKMGLNKSVTPHPLLIKKEKIVRKDDPAIQMNFILDAIENPIAKIKSTL